LELINILIKMVRIFSHLQGPSFMDSSKKIEVSPLSSRHQVGQILLEQKRRIRTGRHEEFNQGPRLLPRIINSWSCRNEKVADSLILDPKSTYDLFDRHKITDEEERSWNQKSPAEKGGPTGSSFIEKTTCCSKMNPLPSGKTVNRQPPESCSIL
jgi:hypothetical protein